MFTHFYLIRPISLGGSQDHQVKSDLVSALRALRSCGSHSLGDGSNRAERLMPPSTADTLWLEVILLLRGPLARGVERVL